MRMAAIVDVDGEVEVAEHGSGYARRVFVCFACGCRAWDKEELVLLLLLVRTSFVIEEREPGGARPD